MTVEHVEDIAGELFKLRQWKAEAVKTISKLEGERDEAVAAVESARAEISRLGVNIGELMVHRDKFQRELNETKHQLAMFREDLASADRTVRVTKAALDAAIEAA
jgi:chromosome segregation ATPase